MAEPKAGIEFPKFVHLRVHSSYSLSEGAIRPEEIGGMCARNDMPAVAVTDTGNLFGLLEIAIYCKKYGVQLIPAAEINFAFEKAANSLNTLYPKMVLIAQNEAGYMNLLKLVSDSYIKGDDHTQPVIIFDELAMHNEGLIVLSGGYNGILDTHIRNNQIDSAQNIIERFKAVFESRFYIELNRVGQEKQAATEAVILNLAESNNLPVVATNNAFFPSADMHEAQDVLTCIAAGTYVNDDNRQKVSREQYFKSQDEMAKLFADLPEALENTVKIAMRCSYMPSECKPMLPNYPTLGGRSDEEELREVAFAGLCKRLGLNFNDYIGTSDSESPEKDSKTQRFINSLDLKHKEYFDRLEFEISVICRMGFPGYFLIVSDFIRWAKSQNIPVGPGRGSGAGSVVAWALEITGLDPLRFGLLFERFLNPERVSMPDFDIDFCQERRGEVIEYVQKKYGHEHVAQIITFGKLQARAVLRDVGRVMQIPYGKVDRISKMIPFNPIDPVTLEKAIALDPELRRERESDEVIAQLLDISLKLEGMHRHASTHAAGVVIGKQRLNEIVPLYTDHRSSIPTTQYSMKYCEAAGLVKFDFLGLKTLTLIQKTVEMIEANDGIKIDIENVPYDDKKTFKMLADGKGIGVFQMESAGMRDSMRKMKIDSIEDIIALISLYRPGPMENIPNYISVKHGKKKPDYLYSTLQPVLQETYGVIIYQEQVMEIAKVLAGYSLGAADLLRRAMGKKIKAEMDAQAELFVAGAVKQGVDKDKAEEIFNLVAKFAGYGFNKSHAAAYAVIGYQTAFLKAHYPAEFLCACLNMEIMDTDKILLFREEARKEEIEILPPDINRSEAYFSVEKTAEGKKAIRYALSALKSVGAEAMKELQRERTENGSYISIDDFVNRVPESVMNKRQLESLSASGAFDPIYKNRRNIYEEAQMLTQVNKLMHEDKNSAQESLFGGDTNSNDQKVKIKEYPEWGRQDRILKEFEAIGFYLDNHPVENILKLLPADRFVLIQDLDEKVPIGYKEAVQQKGGYTKDIYRNIMHISLIGVPNRVVHRTSNGRRFSYFFLSDPTGMVEVNIFDDELINSARDLLESNQPLVVSVEARKDEGGIRLQAENIVLVADYLKNMRSSAEIRIDEENYSPETLAEIKSLFATELKNTDISPVKAGTRPSDPDNRISKINIETHTGEAGKEDGMFKIPATIKLRTKNKFEVKLKLPEGYFITSEDQVLKQHKGFELRLKFG